MGEAPHTNVPAPSFDIVLRGYDRAQVDQFVALLRAADGDTSALPDGHRPPSFDIVLRGYDRAQVDQWIAEATGESAPSAPAPAREGVRLPGTYAAPAFDVVLRGYDRTRVDPVVRRVVATLARDGSAKPVTRVEIAAAAFRRALFGYDRDQVDAWLREIAPRLPD